MPPLSRLLRVRICSSGEEAACGKRQTAIGLRWTGDAAVESLSFVRKRLNASTSEATFVLAQCPWISRTRRTLQGSEYTRGRKRANENHSLLLLLWTEIDTTFSTLLYFSFELLDATMERSAWPPTAASATTTATSADRTSCPTSSARSRAWSVPPPRLPGTGGTCCVILCVCMHGQIRTTNLSCSRAYTNGRHFSRPKREL